MHGLQSWKTLHMTNLKTKDKKGSGTLKEDLPAYFY